jgi:bifunctional DNase/RNase
MWLEMKVKGVALDSMTQMPIVILQDEEEKRSLPIWIGVAEANAIALELEKIPTPRPLTHDLIKSLLDALDARIAKVVVNDLRDNTFFAVIHLRMGSKEVTVDSRPSDAIAVALRVGAPIFVDDEVLSKARTVEVSPGEGEGARKEEEPPAEDPAKVKEWLDSIKPGDFGRMERGGEPGRTDD